VCVPMVLIGSAWLMFAAEGSLVGDMVWHLAFAWAVMLLILAAIVAIGALQ
jgi:hypothetical protein